METKTNLFKIYTENSKTLESYDKICDKLEPVNKLLDDDICNTAILEEQSDVFNLEYLQKLNSQVTFNIVDLIPLETLRRSIDSLAYDLVSDDTVDDNVKALKLTVENQLSNFTDTILTGPSEKIELSINDFKNNPELKGEYAKNMLNYLIIAMDACIKSYVVSNKSNVDVARGIESQVPIITKSDIDETGSISAVSSGITGEIKYTEIEPKKKYHYNDLFNYCVMYYVLYNITNPPEKETTYKDYVWTSYDELKNISHKNDENPELFIIFYNKAQNYIITYLILLQLFPVLTVYASSTKVRDNFQHLELNTYFKKIDDILINAYKDKPPDMYETRIEDEEPEEIAIDKIMDKIVGLIKNVQNIESKSVENIDGTPIRQTGITPLFGQSPFFNKDTQSTARTDIETQQPFKGKGGSCKHIDLRNELLFVKFLFEWSHDFGPNRAAVYVNSDYTYETDNLIPDFYRENGLFQQITKGWKHVIEKREKQISRDYSSLDIEVDKNIFDRLSDKNIHHEESTYIYNIIDALITYCSNIKDDLLYIPITEFTCKTTELKDNSTIPQDTVEFFKNISKYYNNQRMFIKGADTTYNIHLSITSDNTPTAQVPENIDFGYNMQDMNLDPMSIALISKRHELYTEYDALQGITDNNISDFITHIFGTFKDNTTEIISNSKKDEIKTVAKMLDPLPSGKFSVTTIENEKIITQDFFSNETTIWDDNNKLVLDEALKISTIYGINQLLNVWIDNTIVIKNFTYIIEKELIEGINFIASSSTSSSSSTDINEFKWYYGDCTVNVVCGALINVVFNMKQGGLKYDTVLDKNNTDKIIDTDESDFANNVSKFKYQKCKTQWSHIYSIAKYIMFHESFRTEYFPKTIQTFLMIIAYLKSCGDEYQRLTCESMNYLVGNDYEYLLSSLPTDYNKGYLQEIGGNLKNIENFSNIFFLTKDRILIGESIEKNTPLFTNLKTPHDAFYDDEELANDFYKKSDDIKGTYLSKKGIGLMSNRRDILTSTSEKNYENEIVKNNEKIKNLLKAIMLKTNPEHYKELNENINETLINITNYYTQLKQEINKQKNNTNGTKTPPPGSPKSYYESPVISSIHDTTPNKMPQPSQTSTFVDTPVTNYTTSKQIISPLVFSPSSMSDTQQSESPDIPLQRELFSPDESDVSTQSFRQESLPSSPESLHSSQESLPSSQESLPSSQESLHSSPESLHSSEESLHSSEESLPSSQETITLSQSDDKKETYDIQLDIISSLTKLLLGLEYYNKETTIKLKPFYEKCISSEIGKAVSSTIDSDMLNSITLKNSCKIPGTIDALDKIVRTMYDEPEVIDKLLESYETANDMFIKKLSMYKNIVENFNFGIEITNKNFKLKWLSEDIKNNHLNKIFSEEMRYDVISKYNDYLAYIESKKEEYGKKVLNDIEIQMNSELEKMSRSRSNKTRISFAEPTDEEIKEKIIEDLNDFFAQKEELDRKKKHAEAKQQEALEAIEKTKQEKQKGKKSLWQRITSMLSPTEAKKQASEAKKEIKTIDKLLSTVSTSIQKLTDKKQKIEIKDSQKTKIFGYETFKNAFDYLLGRRSKVIDIDETQLEAPPPAKKQRTTLGGTKKHKRKQHYTKGKKLTNNKKHTKYAKKKNIRKQRITKRNK
jgi:hypothetical protein